MLEGGGPPLGITTCTTETTKISLFCRRNRRRRALQVINIVWNHLSLPKSRQLLPAKTIALQV